MARLHFVKKARKADKAAGIKKGDSYYWWKFMVGGRGGVKRKSKVKPRRSSLTQSEFLAAMYDAEDDLAVVLAAFESDGDFEELATACESASEMVRQTGEDCQSKYDNMPDGLQQGDTGQLLEQRVQQADEIADELENAATNIRDAMPDTDASKEEQEQARTNAAGEAESISWDYE